MGSYGANSNSNVHYSLYAISNHMGEFRVNLWISVHLSIHIQQGQRLVVIMLPFASIQFPASGTNLMIICKYDFICINTSQLNLLHRTYEFDFL